ncbi:hypothetical protein SAMN04487881_2171 [Marinobacter sp. es.048]|nr:hypothetical protein SAMN04487881_2171 [Marinobacter sp. es.048]
MWRFYLFLTHIEHTLCTRNVCWTLKGRFSSRTSFVNRSFIHDVYVGLLPAPFGCNGLPRRRRLAFFTSLVEVDLAPSTPLGVLLISLQEKMTQFGVVFRSPLGLAFLKPKVSWWCSARTKQQRAGNSNQRSN